MRIYLAARLSRRAEMRSVREKLHALGHTVTSRWLDTEWSDRPGESSAAPPEYRAMYAVIDLEDVDAADCVVSFTEPPDAAASRGGRHVEHGYALAKGKRTVVVRYRENIFHEHPAVECYPSLDALLAGLGPVTS